MNSNSERKSKQHVWLTGIASALLLGSLMAWTGSDNGATFMGLPVFALCCAIAFLIQWLLFIPAYIYQTERYFDLTGSLTYISVALFACLATGFSEPRALLIAALVLIWATRLGSFLFRRVSKDGEDSRFRSIKPDFLQFLMTWTLQGLWVSVTFAAGLAAMTSAEPLPLDVFAWSGLSLWIAGFAIEVTADTQKSQFKADANNDGKFINTGIWRWSRHPNYFGEIVLWLGITVIALPVLQGLQYATLISPIFVIVLLVFISGVRMLEQRSDRRWGDEPDYLEYKRQTPVLFPMPPSRNS